MKLLVQNPYSKIYYGDVDSVYVTTTVGDAEILEEHAKLSSIVVGKIKLKEKGGTLKEIDLQGRQGILHTDGKEIFILIP
ncbi:MAG: hypothetical protein NZ927_03980 [Candidatus Calescibacterium sp.]|nr:hypothetical protein [Candidatus Calescibacterium sp.]MCX7734285.1 hypothetical protein [bacterium]MDW8087116.1 hypothetical protein [Candidatus Calescibacterium sp.]